MHVSVSADLPGCLIATTGTYTTKMEGLTKLERVAKVISNTNFRAGFLGFRKNNYLLTKLEHRSSGETVVHVFNLIFN